MAGMFKLTDRKVQGLNTPGRYGDGGGLWLQVRSREAKSWIYRFMLNGKTGDYGLGHYPDVSLADARQAAEVCRRKVKAGTNPITERDAAKRLSRAQAEMTFDACAGRYIEAQRSGWKTAKQAEQWTSSLTRYVSPVFGAMPVAEVRTEHVLRVLEPIWCTKTETASRLRARIESVLAWATARGYRAGDNPAIWRNHLDTLLPEPNKVAKVVHLAALPWRDIKAFMVDLATMEGIAARAVAFAILTAARSNEVRGLLWSDLDLDAALWVVPAERMKAGKEHHVPLSDAALAVCRSMPRISGCDLVFPGARGRPLSDMSLTAVLRRMNRTDITVHGFRSTFRDWAAESTEHPREVIEHALAHQLKDKTEAAYQRSTLLDKRRRLMADWAEFCAAP